MSRDSQTDSSRDGSGQTTKEEASVPIDLPTTKGGEGQ